MPLDRVDTIYFARVLYLILYKLFVYCLFPVRIFVFFQILTTSADTAMTEFHC